MVTLLPVALVVGWQLSARLPRDHYVRVDANDYSVHPSAIGRRVNIDEVEVTCDGRQVARHVRCWSAHQSINTPLHRDAATDPRPHQRPDGATLVETAKVKLRRR